MDLFSSFESRRRISDLRAVTARQETTTDSLRRQLEDSQGKLDNTMLALVALVELLAERGITTRDELLARMDLVDLRDGKRDGKISSKVVDCPECLRPLNTNQSKCLYCEAQRPPGTGVLS